MLQSSCHSSSLSVLCSVCEAKLKPPIFIFIIEPHVALKYVFIFFELYEEGLNTLSTLYDVV